MTGVREAYMHALAFDGSDEQSTLNGRGSHGLAGQLVHRPSYCGRQTRPALWLHLI